jgi:nucleotide-binding universal stress UspA family protein
MLPIKKILCPTDFSEASYKALTAANELALHCCAELYLVHIFSSLEEVPPDFAGSGLSLWEIEELLKGSAENSLQEVAKKVSKELHVRQTVTLGEAADEIIRISRSEKVDLIVMATHGQTGWRHLVFGSVAEKVLRLAPCPVLTIGAQHGQMN